MTMRSLVTLVIVLIACSGCAAVSELALAEDVANAPKLTQPAQAHERTDKKKVINSKLSMLKHNSNKPEALSAVRFDGTAFHAGVLSFGCTGSTDFMVEHTVVDGQCLVTIVRTNPDMCRRAPMLAELSIPWKMPEDCSELDLVVANPVLVTNASGGLSKQLK